MENGIEQGQATTKRKQETDVDSPPHRSLIALDRCLTGVVHGADRYRVWYTIYLLLVFALTILGRRGPSPPLGRGITAWSQFLLVQPLVVEEMVVLVALMLMHLVVQSARSWYRVSLERPFPRVVFVITLILSLLVVTFFAQPLTPAAWPVLVAGMRALLFTTLLIGFVLIMPGLAFNPDFIALATYRRISLLVENTSAAALFLLGAEKLLVWPRSPAWPKPLSGEEMSRYLASPGIRPDIVDDNLLKGGIIWGLVLVLLLSLFVFYSHLAHRRKKQGLWKTMTESVALMWRNLKDRIRGASRQVWPVSPQRTAQIRRVASMTAEDIEPLVSSATLSAVSLSFGLWTVKAASSKEGMPFVVLVLFLAGGAGVWRAALDTSGKRGSFYTFGVWLGTLPLYYVTGLFVVLGLGVLAAWSATVVPAQRAIALQGTFSTLYRIALGTVSVVVAVSKSRHVAGPAKHHRTSRYSLAVVALFVVLGLGINAAIPPAGIIGASRIQVSVRAFGLLVAVVAATVANRWPRLGGSSWSHKTIRYGIYLVAFFVILGFCLSPREWLKGAEVVWLAGIAIAGSVAASLFFLAPTQLGGVSVDPLGAQLAASSSMALAPLLLSKRIQKIRWVEQGFAELTVNGVGISREPMTLRVRVMGSEEEVAFEALSDGHVPLRGELDFVLTDLRTAIQIMGECRSRGGGATYRILCPVGDIPWTHLVLRAGETADDCLLLDSGFLRYNPVQGRAPLPGHPYYLRDRYIRPTSLAGVAHYSVEGLGDVDEAMLAAPYTSWVVRKRRERDLPCRPDKPIMVPYVLLARWRRNNRPPLVSYNWRMTMCEMLWEGQRRARENKTSVDTGQIDVVQSFLKRAVGDRVQLGLEDVYLGLCRSSLAMAFQPEFSFDHIQVLHELEKHAFLKSEARTQYQKKTKDAQHRGNVIREALGSTEPSVLYHGDSGRREEDAEEDFFGEFCRRQVTDASETPADYLGRLVAIMIPDKKGTLANLLKALRQNGQTEHLVDLAMIASTNLGDSVLVYLVNKDEIPPPGGVQESQLGKPWKTSARRTEWIEALQEHGYDVVEVECLVVPARHEQGALLEVIKHLAPDKTQGRAGINIEQLFTIHLDEQTDLLLVVCVPRDWQAAIDLLTKGEHRATEPSWGEGTYECEKVDLARRPGLQRHLQHAVFPKVSLRGDEKVEFSCDGLAVWTPTWGSVDSWLAEIGFNQIRLKIPTFLPYAIFALGWIGKLPLVGGFVAARLGGIVPGIAGYSKYKEELRWKMTVTRPNDKLP